MFSSFFCVGKTQYKLGCLLSLITVLTPIGQRDNVKCAISEKKKANGCPARPELMRIPERI